MSNATITEFSRKVGWELSPTFEAELYPGTEIDLDQLHADFDAWQRSEYVHQMPVAIGHISMKSSVAQRLGRRLERFDYQSVGTHTSFLVGKDAQPRGLGSGLRVVNGLTSTLRKLVELDGERVGIRNGCSYIDVMAGRFPDGRPYKGACVRHRDLGGEEEYKFRYGVVMGEDEQDGPPTEFLPGPVCKADFDGLDLRAGRGPEEVVTFPQGDVVRFGLYVPHQEPSRGSRRRLFGNASLICREPLERSFSIP